MQIVRVTPGNMRSTRQIFPLADLYNEANSVRIDEGRDG